MYLYYLEYQFYKGRDLYLSGLQLYSQYLANNRYSIVFSE